MNEGKPIVKYSNSQTQIMTSGYSRYASRLCLDVSSLLNSTFLWNTPALNIQLTQYSFEHYNH